MKIEFEDNLNRVDHPIIDGLIHALYCDTGRSAVFDFANQLIELGHHSIEWEWCKPCDSESPTWYDEHTCFVCGSETSEMEDV